jgi:hypothetical protein
VLVAGAFELRLAKSAIAVQVLKVSPDTLPTRTRSMLVVAGLVLLNLER